MLSNFGGLVQAVGAAWLMTLIAASDTQVALVQASTTLPVMAFSLVSGAVADSFDRRRVMLLAQLFMFSASVGLVLVTYLDLINAWSLLGLTFLIGCGVAFNNPAWQASVRDFVGMDLLPKAVLLNGVGFNVTRSVAPAIGGVIVAVGGAMVAFAVNAVSYLGILFALWTWSGPKRQPQNVREPLGSAISAGVRYARMSPNLQRLYCRGFFFGLSAIVVLALLPLVTRDLLGGDSLSFGILLGAFGIGAVVAGVTSEQIAQRFSSEVMVRMAFLAMAIAVLLCSLSTWFVLTLVAVCLSGWAWVLALALFNTTVQLSTPRWVVGRAMSFYQMFTFGGMALGSWLWGWLVEQHSLPLALQLAALSMAVGLLLGFRWPLPSREELDLNPLDRWQEPNIGVNIEPRSGPVSVAVEYRIAEPDIPEFCALMRERRRIRRRDGARQWTLLRRLEGPKEEPEEESAEQSNQEADQWIERFELATWADYVRMHSRTTQVDGKVGDQIRGLHLGPQPPQVRRMLVRDPARIGTANARQEPGNLPPEV